MPSASTCVIGCVQKAGETVNGQAINRWASTGAGSTGAHEAHCDVEGE